MHRLDLRLPNDLYDEVCRHATAEGLSVADWVGRVLAAASGAGSEDTATAAKLAVIREAAGHEFPTASIDELLAQLAEGRSGGTSDTSERSAR